MYIILIILFYKIYFNIVVRMFEGTSALKFEPFEDIKNPNIKIDIVDIIGIIPFPKFTHLYILSLQYVSF